MSRSTCLVACVVSYVAVTSLGCQRSSNGPASSQESDSPKIVEVKVIERDDLPEPSDYAEDLPDFDDDEDLPAPPTEPSPQAEIVSYWVVRQNADGSHDVEVKVTLTTWESRSRVEQGQDGQEHVVSYEVAVPVTRTMLITTPPFVNDIETYLEDQLAN